MTSPRETTTQKPREGDAAPKFELAAFPRGMVSLDDFLGQKNVILAFYPKDDTPGCTKEMCAFSQDLAKFESIDTCILGISCDSVESHELFARKHNLQHKLLSDPEGEVGKLYGTIGEGQIKSSRVLFLIDKEGIIQYIVEGMPETANLLEMLKKI